MNKIIIILSILLLLISSSCDITEPPTPLPEYDSIDEAPAWSPDGKWIAYNHFSRNINDSLYSTGLYIVDPNGINRKLLIKGNVYSPDWSPDGKKIVFTNGNLFIIDIDTKQINQLTYNGSDFFPSWSPDGTKISFDRSGTPDTVGTWIINLITLAQIKFGFFGQLDWSLTGERIIFSGKSENSNSVSKIWAANSDGTNQQRLTSNDFSYNRYPKWSADDSKIVWEILRKNRIDAEIWIMNSNSSNQIKLTDGGYPDWSPDNKRIVYSRPVNNKIALFIIDIDTREIEQLTF